MDHMQDVVDFHRKFGLAYEGKPRLLEADLQRFRSMFLYEELEEFDDACFEGNLVKAFDALLDLVYVVLGTAHLMGLSPHWDQGWEAVQSANMRKERGMTPNRLNEMWDVRKPEGWVGPEETLKKLIQP